MKMRAIFRSDGDPVIELTPENEGEKRLLASVLKEDAHGRVHVKDEWRLGYHSLELVSITLKNGKYEGA
jgi:hypothetical protein